MVKMQISTQANNCNLRKYVTTDKKYIPRQMAGSFDTLNPFESRCQ